MSDTAPPSTDHRRGIQLAASGVLVLSLDALLIRLAAVDPWVVAFWRGSLMLLTLGTLVLLSRQIRVGHLLRTAWRPLLGLAALYGINGTLFVLSISHTSVANTVVILSSSAFFAAFFSWLLLRERVRVRTWMAIVASIIGVLTVFAGSLGLDSWRGDGLALLLALSMGLMLSLMRRYPALPRILIVALSGAVMATIALPMAGSLAVPLERFGWLALMGLVQIPLASVLIMSATRYLSSPEVSLFLLIETVFGPIWVWWVLQETVTPLTLAGGAIILTAIMLHSWLALREQHRLSPS
ncbi:DMT family transporter [Motiliproteus sediminis]|uniref:DMT family transporter n=1 Tax=Motiliproteus sediminis TaxID=1468178 RepID=UPI001FEBEC2B|nr:DMT family transporter [Motiliproteus sediminis]